MRSEVIKKLIRESIKKNSLTKDRPFFHYCYAIYKNKVISFGKSEPTKTHPSLYKIAIKLQIEKFINYPYPHAEYSMIHNLNKLDINFKNIQVLVLRINRHGIPMLSKPCINCLKLIEQFNPSFVWYSEIFDKKNAKLIVSNLLNDKIEIQMTKTKKGLVVL
jgi:hypothetical protein